MARRALVTLTLLLDASHAGWVWEGWTTNNNDDAGAANPSSGAVLFVCAMTYPARAGRSRTNIHSDTHMQSTHARASACARTHRIRTRAHTHTHTHTHTHIYLVVVM